MESLAPNVFVNNMNETIEFYKILGFEIISTVPEEGDFIWVMMKNGNVTMMFQTFDSLGAELPSVQRTDGGSLIFYINLKGIREFYNKIKDKVSVFKGLETTFYGATEFSIIDNNSYVLTFAEHE